VKFILTRTSSTKRIGNDREMVEAAHRGTGDRPYPARSGRLPRHVDDVSAEWLTGLLANRYPGIVVDDLEVLDIKSSHTTKVRVAWALNDVGRRAGIPGQVCLKSNWSGMATGDICEREARFYHLVGDDLTAPVPRSFYADWDDDGSGAGIVVMEDLAATPGRFGASTDWLGIDGVAAGLQTLATLHGALWGSDRLDQAGLAGSMDTIVDTEQVIQFWNYIAFNLTDPDYAAVVPEWVHTTPWLMQFALDELSAHERQLPGPKCLVHGDAHQGNSFLRASGERVWLDWQLVRQGSPWRDVSYFIVSSLTVEERRAADRDLVERYRQSLLATGAAGVPDAGRAWSEFVLWPAYGTQAWLGNVNVWGQSSGAEMVRRAFAAAEDYDTVGLLTRGRVPRRTITLGKGAYRLPKALHERLAARLRR
jgi:Phosphotransferase enzyme family